MPRVKRGTKRRARRKKLLKHAKGFFLTKGKLFRSAKEAVNRSLRYTYRDRRTRKRDYRTLWIQRIGAAARNNGISYSQLIHGLKAGGIDLDRKILADMAVRDAEGFAALVASAKQHMQATRRRRSPRRSTRAAQIVPDIRESSRQTLDRNLGDTTPEHSTSRASREVLPAASNAQAVRRASRYRCRSSGALSLVHWTGRKSGVLISDHRQLAEARAAGTQARRRPGTEQAQGARRSDARSKAHGDRSRRRAKRRRRAIRSIFRFPASSARSARAT